MPRKILIDIRTKGRNFESVWHSPDLDRRVRHVLSRIPVHLIIGVRSVTVYPPERATLYVPSYAKEMPGVRGHYDRNGHIFVEAGDALEFNLAHEIGHHVHEYHMTDKHRIRLGNVIGWSVSPDPEKNWAEAFAYAFAFYYTKSKRAAKQAFPDSWGVLKDLV